MSSGTTSGAALFCSGVAVGAASALTFSWLRHLRGRDDEDEDDDSSEDEDEDDPPRLKSAHPVRDDYAGDETYKVCVRAHFDGIRRALVTFSRIRDLVRAQMLLIFNMELYKLSSKTGEMKSVKMSPGKAAAQSGHATLGAYRRGMRLCPNACRDWLRIGQMKITVKCPTVEELLELEQRCAAAGLNTYLIRDAGHTEIEPGSRTVLAVGPAPASAMDPLTRQLKPY